MMAVLTLFTHLAASILGGLRDRVEDGVQLQNAHAVSNMAMAVISSGNPEFDGLTTKEEVVHKIVEGLHFSGTGETNTTATLRISPNQIAEFLDLLDWNPTTRVLSLKRE